GLCLALLIVELGLVSNQLIHFVPRQASAVASQSPNGTLTDNSRPSKEYEQEPLLWTNVARASLARFTKTDAPLLTRQVDLQNRFLIGKLAVFTPARNLSAIQTIEPASSEKIRLWLSTQDTLGIAQNELDSYLATLGVQYRLVASEEEARASGRERNAAWKAIPGAKPLCECLPLPGTDTGSPARVSDPATPSPSIRSYEWTRADQLMMETECPSACRLLIRQFNDGGWEIVGKTRDLQAIQLEPLITPSIFLEVDLPKGTTTIQISRKWGW
ncbi:MAG: hypothetical protein AAGG44_08775, partial [Planctomycetota bacterium]